MRKIAAFIADTHGGHKLGLLNPETELFEEDQSEGTCGWYYPTLTKTQTYLWDRYEAHRRALWEFAGTSQVNLFHDGDITHGDKYPHQLVSTRRGDQLLIGEENLAIWCEEGVSSIRLAQGTNAHIFGEGTSTMLVTKALMHRYPHVDVNMTAHGRANFDGYRIDYAHHGPHPGTRVWLDGNQLRYYAKDIMLRSILHAEDPPDAIIRAHYHTFRHEVVEFTGHKTWRTHIWVLPCYCGLSDHARQAVRSPTRVDVGMIALEIVDGELGRVKELRDTLKLVKEECF